MRVCTVLWSSSVPQSASARQQRVRGSRYLETPTNPSTRPTAKSVKSVSSGAKVIESNSFLIFSDLFFLAKYLVQGFSNSRATNDCDSAPGTLWDCSRSVVRLISMLYTRRIISISGTFLARTGPILKRRNGSPEEGRVRNHQRRKPLGSTVCRLYFHEYITTFSLFIRSRGFSEMSCVCREHLG